MQPLSVLLDRNGPVGSRLREHSSLTEIVQIVLISKTSVFLFSAIGIMATTADVKDLVIIGCT